ncbi:hypothetical protein VPNG_03066 [Cytospora leucostoma]|uniref:FAD-binding domain-containing protein n=1 Tax=Cytospora leucostoma TaxID=1230097 RepID=A0A423XGD4_9PEZI|nr:hypothetical protein VPNG_03066 [Cytospora leucostoma]
MTQLRVLICGGGITGNALAFQLSKLNHDVTVIERFPDLRTTGLQIDLRGSGIEVMKRMGLEEKFRAKAVDEEGTKVVGSSGRTWAYFKANKTGEGLQSFTSDFEIMRGDLCRILYEATDNRVKYVFGKVVESYEEKDDCIEVLFSNGHKDQYDLLIGADGQASRTRRMMLGPGTVDPIHYLNLHIGYFTMPRPIREGEGYNATLYAATGRRAILMRRHNPHQIQVYLQAGDKAHSERMAKVRKGDVPEEKKAMAEIFQGAGWQTEDFLKGLEASDDFYCERLGVVKMDSWSSGRVVLVGDAAYCPSAATGMGTTCGLVGAYVLAGEIARHCQGPEAKAGLPVALKAYDDRFRPFINQVQEGIVEKASTWQRLFPSSALAVAILNLVVAAVAFLRLDVIGQWILREDVGDWILPDYEELVDRKIGEDGAT